MNEKGDDSMKLNRNMGTLDRIIRLVIAAVIAILYFTGNLSGLAAIILGVLAVIFIVTSAIGFCPLYLLFGLSTRKK
jgi:amino acid transporter